MLNNLPKLKTGNVCVSERGNLFIFYAYTSAVVGEKDTPVVKGIGFNGSSVITPNSEKIAENLDEYLEKTYGNNYSKELGG